MALELAVTRPVHARHSAGAGQLLELVSPGEQLTHAPEACPFPGMREQAHRGVFRVGARAEVALRKPYVPAPSQVILMSTSGVEARAMKIAKLDALRAWQLMLALVGLGVGTALAVWGFVWVIWTIRPLVAGAAAILAVAWTLYAIHRHRRSEEWHGEEWLGS